MELKAVLCCALSILLVSCGGADGTFVPGGGSSTTPPSQQQTDGQVPSGLVQGSDGNFYGVTLYGGDNGLGTVFRLTLAGVETVLYSFAGGTADGEYPQGLIQGSDGNFYGTTSNGGVQNCPHTETSGSSSTTTTGGCGVVFKVTPSGVESVVYTFTGKSDGGEPSYTLIQANNGSFYGTAQMGAGGTGCTYGCGAVFQITTGGAETILYAFKGSAAGDGALPFSVIQGTDGNLYGTTNLGGPGNFGTIFGLTLGGVESVLYSFQGQSDGSYPTGPLTEGTDGNFYGTETFGGAGFGTIFEVTTAGVKTTLYAFKGSPTDGAIPGPLTLATDGEFYGITDDGGSVTTCTSGCGTFFSFTTAGGETPLYQFPAAGTTTTVEPPLPFNLMQASDGNLYGTTSADGQYGFGTIFRMTVSGTKSVVYSFGAIK